CFLCRSEGDHTDLHSFPTRRSSDLKKEAQEEAVRLQESSKERGFQEGLTSLNKHIFALNDELEVLRKEIQKNILPLALKAAKKIDRKSTRLNSSHVKISYAVFCLKK